MTNLELKVPAGDLDPVRRRALAAGATERGLLDQVDTFFAVARGLLKLRVVNGRDAELIAYRRDRAPGPKTSDYALVPVADPDRMLEVLSRSHARLIEVRKRRELLMLGGTRIHLDRVEGLGAFVELETTAGDRTADEMRAEHDRVIAALGLDVAAALPGPYAEMLLGRALED